MVGYTQVEYFGITITNVHTKGAWVANHIEQLHAEVKTGIVAGDFNHVEPEKSSDSRDWHQTDVNLQATHSDGKINHILTVEPHYQAEATALEYFGSNHKMLFTRFKLIDAKLRIVEPGVGPIR